MTREQQITTRNLERAQSEYLISFGWQPEGRRWRHPRFHNGQILCTMDDAMAQTRAIPQLGWPQRSTA